MDPIADFLKKTQRQYAEKSEALLEQVVLTTPIEHLWRLAIIEAPMGKFIGTNFAGQPSMYVRELPVVCSMIPDIIGGIVYDSRPNPELVRLRNEAMAARAA